jgi:putative ABC transport system permease protein
MTVDEELQAIELAAAPIDQGTTLIAAISVFVGLLFSFTAMLPTLTDRRRLVVSLRMMGYGRARVVQILAFQAIVLGVCASAVGLLIGLLLANGTGHDPTGYLTFAFPLSTERRIDWETIVPTIVGGVLASCLAAAQPLLDMRSGSASIAVLRRQSEPMHAVTARLRRTLAACGLALIVLAGSVWLLASSMMIVGAVATAVAIVLAVPAAFAAILRLSEGPASRWRLSSLTLALRALRATSPLALGLVATGAVAVFGAVGLRGTHASLLHGMYADFRGYLGTADVWVAQPGDDLALEPFDARGVARRVAAVGGVRDVRTFYGGLLDVGVRRVWVMARLNRDRTVVPASQVVDGDVRVLERRVRAGGWVTVSQQIAAAEGVAVGGTIRLPTPTGEVAYRVAATTTNLGWGPGAVVMNARDYRRAWDDDDPSALEVDVARGADVAAVARSIRRALGNRDGALWVQTARERVARVSETARDGLAWSGRGAMLLLIAAGFAMSAAIGAGTWQRRVAFGHLRLMGWRPVKLWCTLLWEAALVLGTGCIVGAAAGAYGHYAGDRWLRRSTDYPASFSVAAGQTVTICLLVFAVTLIVTAVPGVLMSRTPPRAGLDPDR